MPDATPTLTKLQIEALRDLAEHTAHWHRYMGRFNPVPYWSLKFKRRTKQVDALIKRGLAEIVRLNNYGDRDAVITDAGRAWLAQATAADAPKDS